MRYLLFSKFLCARAVGMTVAWVLTATILTVATGPCHASLVSPSLGDTNAGPVLPYRPVVETHARIVVTGAWFMSANAQARPVEQKIPIKPRYAKVLCRYFQEGEFEKVHSRIERWWDGFYTLEDLYLSLRCGSDAYKYQDLASWSMEYPGNIHALISMRELEEYFRKIAEEHGGESLLTKVLYCEVKYLWAGMRDFFGYLDYQIDLFIIRLQRVGHSDSHIRDRIRPYLRLRQLMLAHVSDFPFPDPQLALGPSETIDYRREWCREHFSPE